MPPHVLVDFVVFPPGHGKSVADFWVWDAHEAQLRCPGDVSGDRGRYSAWRSLKLRESSPSGKIPTVEPGIESGTSWLVIGDSDY